MKIILTTQESESLVENIQAYLAQNPANDDEFKDMVYRLNAIEISLIKILIDSGVEGNWTPQKVIEGNPYAGAS